MLFSPRFKARCELLTLYFGVSTFVLHALIIFLLKWGRQVFLEYHED